MKHMILVWRCWRHSLQYNIWLYFVFDQIKQNKLLFSITWRIYEFKIKITLMKFNQFQRRTDRWKASIRDAPERRFQYNCRYNKQYSGDSTNCLFRIFHYSPVHHFLINFLFSTVSFHFHWQKIFLRNLQ